MSEKESKESQYSLAPPSSAIAGVGGVTSMLALAPSTSTSISSQWWCRGPPSAVTLRIPIVP